MQTNAFEASYDEAMQWEAALDDGWPSCSPPGALLMAAAAQRYADATWRALGFEEYAVLVQEDGGARWHITTGLGAETASAMTQSQWDAWIDDLAQPLLFGLATEMAG